jgi:hypothetical protein
VAAGYLGGVTAEGSARLRADCGRCVGLCCVAPAFGVSADFAIDKPAGRPCPNLQSDYGCGIHAELRGHGFAGCAVFDCFGAGQQVTQVTFAGRSWRDDPAVARPMFDVFGVMRALHELLWLLAEAVRHATGSALEAELTAAYGEIELLTNGTAAQVADVDPDAWRGVVNPMLLEVSAAVRRAAREQPPDHRGADLTGVDLRGADLRAAGLRGARLLGADLREADLRLADVTGADLRGADLADADLTAALFLMQSQLESARGNAGTALSAELVRPAHWR